MTDGPVMVSSAFAVLLALTLTPVDLESDGTRAWFLATYPAAAMRGVAVYDRLKMGVTCEFRRGDRTQPVIDAAYTAFDGRFRLDVFRDDPNHYADIYIGQPGDSVIVRVDDRCSSRPHYKVEGRDYETMVSGLRNSFRFPFTPWFVDARTICEVLLSDDVLIWKVHLLDDPEQGRVCDVYWTANVVVPPIPSGRFRFAVDRNWVLLSRTHMVDAHHGLAIHLHYDDCEIDGVSIVQSSEHYVVRHGREILMQRYLRRSCRPLASAPDVFDPTFFRIAAGLSGTISPVRTVWDVLFPMFLAGAGLGICVCGLRTAGRWRTHESDRCRAGPFIGRDRR